MRRLVLALAGVLSACEGAPLERSCNGETVGLCDPYEHSEVSSASLEPAELVIADFTMRAQIRVEIARCEDAPALHSVELSALVPAEERDGGGGGMQVMSLLTLREGRDGDPVEGDGIIEADVSNPFIATIPPESDITLRFTPRSTTIGGCTGEPAEIAYRTGTARP